MRCCHIVKLWKIYVDQYVGGLLVVTHDLCKVSRSAYVQ